MRSISAYFASTRESCSCVFNPAAAAYFVSRLSAVSCRSFKRYSARAVNIRYGSFVPSVTRSSIKTPIYASSRPRTSGDHSGIMRNFSNPASFCAFSCIRLNSAAIFPLSAFRSSNVKFKSIEYGRAFKSSCAGKIFPHCI